MFRLKASGCLYCPKCLSFVVPTRRVYAPESVKADLESIPAKGARACTCQCTCSKKSPFANTHLIPEFLFQQLLDHKMFATDDLRP